MLIAATSDLHGHLPEIPECDLLLLAGDLCPVTDHAFGFQRNWLEHQFTDWIGSRRCGAERVVWIAGNHDLALEQMALDTGAPGPRLAAAATYLQDSSVEIDGLLVYGTPWSEIIGPWAFSLPEEDRGAEARPDLRAAYSVIPAAAEIVLVHGPPAGYGDRTYDGRRVGSPSLLARVEEVRPRLCVFGHIHEDHGRWEHRGITLANVSHVDEGYRPVNPPQLFEWPRSSGSR
jgi:Icc-related predicted phosphoesterase